MFLMTLLLIIVRIIKITVYYVFLLRSTPHTPHLSFEKIKAGEVECSTRKSWDNTIINCMELSYKFQTFILFFRVNQCTGEDSLGQDPGFHSGKLSAG